MSEAALGTQDSACVSGGAACSRAEKPTLSYGKPNEDNRRLNRRSVKSCDRLNDENSPVVAKRLSKPRSNRSTDARSGEENAINGWALELVGMAATASTQSDKRRTYSHRLSVDDSPCFASSATLYLVTLGMLLGDGVGKAERLSGLVGVFERTDQGLGRLDAPSRQQSLQDIACDLARPGSRTKARIVAKLSGELVVNARTNKHQ